MKTRMLGAAVLIALAVLFLPMLFSSTPPKSDADQTVSLAIPPAPDRELQTRTLDVAPNGSPATVNGPQTAGAVPQQPAAAVSAPSASVIPGSGGRLASVDIASRKPADALPEDFANAPAASKPAATPATPAKPAARPATTPVASAPPATPAAAPVALPPGTAARGSYSINLSAYADRSKADALVQKVKALGYPVSTASTTQAGKSLTRVTAGPFESRAAAETARLKIVAAVPGAPASLSTKAETQTADAPAPSRPAATTPAPAAATPSVPTAAPRAGGFAVQVAAVSSETEATRLRDKLRGAGIPGYVDSIASSSGAKLWRVRAGPQTQRDDAVRLKDQIKAKVGLDGVVVPAP
ncbi:cell division septation protein DedD [Luteibacter jiangsuensis]|uniref:Cell division septation protein DedD n=1 Tax=Luteibacter jiangsuensis TaxID=637577 RepID=A0ABT9SVQ8_9GAMM|nr:SPOR domain-containing protein [Luteibacter jiangsuensis]MDQ0008860.1 cell division septation protein DedD [Luteibacter jiangsuensis]